MTSGLIPSSNEVIAINACKYARQYILEVSTQLVNNTYTIFKQNHDFSLELDDVIRKFYKSIDNCKKFSLGNCHELALMALDYVTKYTPIVDAEIYQIKGGDHVFLVIERAPGSNIYRPETWGIRHIYALHGLIRFTWLQIIYPKLKTFTIAMVLIA